jgi:predicted enzyme related to lactoylglutathione lyase
MGTRESHEPGTFSWVELATTDAAAAKEFYGGLFGWDYDDRPANGMTYTMARKEGSEVAAIFQRDDVPPVWGSYVTVTSADEAAARAAELGATTMTPPFDVMTAGRMAALQDPTGAMFFVWEPRDNIGARFVNAPGALTLQQLNTTDPEKAIEFYSGLFGWRIEQVGSDPTPYWGIYNGNVLNGGLMQQPGTPSHWLVYFGSESAGDDAERVKELGGNVIVELLDVPGGQIAVATDPQGAVFGLFSGRFDD